MLGIKWDDDKAMNMFHYNSMLNKRLNNIENKRAFIFHKVIYLVTCFEVVTSSSGIPNRIFMVTMHCKMKICINVC